MEFLAFFCLCSKRYTLPQRKERWMFLEGRRSFWESHQSSYWGPQYPQPEPVFILLLCAFARSVFYISTTFPFNTLFIPWQNIVFWSWKFCCQLLLSLNYSKLLYKVEFIGMNYVSLHIVYYIMNFLIYVFITVFSISLNFLLLSQRLGQKLLVRGL